MEKATSRREGQSFFSDMAYIFKEKSYPFRNMGRIFIHWSYKQHLHYVSWNANSIINRLIHRGYNQRIRQQRLNLPSSVHSLKLPCDNIKTLDKVMHAVHTAYPARGMLFHPWRMADTAFRPGTLAAIVGTTHCAIRHIAYSRRAQPHSGLPGSTVASDSKTTFRPFALCGGGLRARRHAGAHEA